jgi:chromosome segregation ATPase
MVMKTLLRFAVAGLFVAFAAVVASAQDPASDDVAAAARKAREQQKTAPKPKKVVTNDDIPSKSTDSDAKPATPAAEGQDSAGQANEATKDENDPKKEAYWHKKYTETHDKQLQAEKDLDVLQRELNTDQVQYYSDPQKALVEQHNRTDINEKTAKVDAKKKEIETLKQQLSDLDDECRKAGCDPGWVR